MTDNNSIGAIYASHSAAEAAIKELQQNGFDMRKIALREAEENMRHD
jgi:hypothetical protein